MSLFPKQLDFILDPSSHKTACCSRRAGKTHGIFSFLYASALLRKGSTQLYIGLTRDATRRIFWPKIVEINEHFQLKLKLNESALRVTVPQTNGSIILASADQDKLADRLRGDAYGAIAVDESQSFGSSLQYLIDEVLEPACMDYSGQIALVGTPGPVPTGVFYDATRAGSGYSNHSFTMFDNPFILNAQAYIDALKAKRKWTDDNPTLLREYYGIWAYDPEALVYRFLRSKNVAARPEGGHFEHVIGVDLGYNDAFAISVLAFSDDINQAYVVHVERHHKTLPDFWAHRIIAVMAMYPKHIAVEVDCGALGKTIVEQMRVRYSLPLNAAEKGDKMANIELVNNDFRSERLFVEPHCVDAIDQLMILKKDKNGKEDPNLPNDICDTILYAHRKCRHYFSKDVELKPVHGSAEYWAAEEQSLLERAINGHEKQSEW
jgi:hypothetical protein